MTVFRTLVLAAALASGLNSAAAVADPRDRGPRPSMSVPPRRDADRAWEATRDGHSMPLPQLEQRVMPMMGGADYLGPELNGNTYRFKFLQNGRVIWVDVDGQGRVIRRSRDR